MNEPVIRTARDRESVAIERERIAEERENIAAEREHLAREAARAGWYRPRCGRAAIALRSKAKPIRAYCCAAATIAI
jgi:hypothetical protein